MRWNQRHRRKLGVAYAAVGAAGVVLILCFVNNVYQEAKATLDLTALSPAPSSQQLAIAADETRFAMGFALGFLCAGALGGMVVLAGTGCALLLTNSRKDTLLLKCWDGGAAAQ